MDASGRPGSGLAPAQPASAFQLDHQNAYESRFVETRSSDGASEMPSSVGLNRGESLMPVSESRGRQ